MVKSPLSGWVGGKFHLSKRIVSLIPEHVCYVEAFAGAAWTLFRKDPSEVEVINDINMDVVTLYRVLQNHQQALYDYFRWSLYSRDEFERLHRVDPSTLTDIQRAARFLYVQKAGFGGKISGSPSFGISPTRPPKLNLNRLDDRLSDAHHRLQGVYVEHLHYSDCIRRYDRAGTFYYLDPPYWGCTDYYGKLIFAEEDFGLLADQLKGIKGKFVLSINDVPEIRALFRDFNIATAETVYSLGSAKVKKVTELLISNY